MTGQKSKIARQVQTDLDRFITFRQRNGKTTQAEESTRNVRNPGELMFGKPSLELSHASH